MLDLKHGLGCKCDSFLLQENTNCSCAVFVAVYSPLTFISKVILIIKVIHTYYKYSFNGGRCEIEERVSFLLYGVSFLVIIFRRSVLGVGV